MPKNRLFDEDVLVVGLGRFGSATASELQRLGHNVVGVEKSSEVAARYVGTLHKVVHVDSSTSSAVEAMRARSFGIAVVAIGSSLEASILTCANLVDAGVPVIWAKARTREHARILERIGVHHVVQPEAESGRRVAHLVNGKLLDYMEFAGGYAIASMTPPRETIGFTLAQSQVQTRYGVSVIAVKAPGEDFAHALPDTKVMAQHQLVVSGPSDLVVRFAARP